MTQTMIKSKPVLAAEAVLRELLETLPSSPNLIETLTLNMLAAYEFTKTEEAFYAQYLFGETTSGNELVDALDDTVTPTEPQFTARDEDYETTFEFYSPDEDEVPVVVTQEQKEQSDAEALDAFKQRFGAPSSAPLPIKWPKPETPPAAPATRELFTQPQLMIAGRLINILTEMFDMADNVPITQEMTLYTLPIPDTTCGPLDSLDIVELVMMIEETFDIEIPNEDAETFETKTFGEIVRFIEKAM